MLKGCLVLVLGGFLCVGGCVVWLGSVAEDAAKQPVAARNEPAEPTIQIGKVCELVGSNGTVLIALADADYVAFEDARFQNDSYGVQELLEANRIGLVQSGTPALVKENGILRLRVRILDGDNSGKVVTVSRDDVSMAYVAENREPGSKRISQGEADAEAQRKEKVADLVDKATKNMEVENYDQAKRNLLAARQIGGNTGYEDAIDGLLQMVEEKSPTTTSDSKERMTPFTLLEPESSEPEATEITTLAKPRTKTPSDEDEAAAASVLRMAKQLGNKPDWLQKVIDRHPGTKAAKEAAELLAD